MAFGAFWLLAIIRGGCFTQSADALSDRIVTGILRSKSRLLSSVQTTPSWAQHRATSWLCRQAVHPRCRSSLPRLLRPDSAVRGHRLGLAPTHVPATFYSMFCILRNRAPQTSAPACDSHSRTAIRQRKAWPHPDDRISRSTRPNEDLLAGLINARIRQESQSAQP